MYVVLLIILLLIGVLCLMFTLSKFFDQRRFKFKNKQMMKKQQATMMIGVIGVILIVVAWLAFHGL